MLAKVIAYSPQRTSTILRLKQVLSSSQILIEGGTANHNYLKEILSHPEFQNGTWHTQKLYLPPPPSRAYFELILVSQLMVLGWCVDSHNSHEPTGVFKPDVENPIVNRSDLPDTLTQPSRDGHTNSSLSGIGWA